MPVTMACRRWPMPTYPQQDDDEIRGPSQSPELRLWLEVVMQAMRDLSPRGAARVKGDRERVVTWVGTQNFCWVCFNANLEPEAVAREFRRIIREKGME